MNSSKDYIGSRVSVIMPAYNAEDTLERAIKSVLTQSYGDLELLIVNDCSTDGTEFILSKYAHLAQVRIFENVSNLGVANSRNIALSNASGRYIAFLDADDYWEFSKIEKQVNFMTDNNYGICFTAYWRIKGLEKKRVNPPLVVTKEKMLIRNFIPNLTAMYDRAKVPLVYQINVPHEDYAMWYNLLMHSDAFCLDEPLAFYSVSPGSISGNKFRSLVWHYKIKRDVMGLGIIKSALTMLPYIIGSIKLRIFS